MKNKTEFEIGRSVITGWRRWLAPGKPVTLTWEQMRRRVRVTVEEYGGHDTVDFIVPLIRQFTDHGGRVVILDPLLDWSKKTVNRLWANLHHEYPGMTTVSSQDELALLESFMSDELKPLESRVIFVPQISVARNDEDLLRLMRAEQPLRIIHQAAGRQLGAPLEGPIRWPMSDGMRLDCIPTLVVAQNLDQKVRDHGMYQRHLRAANMAIVDLLRAEPALPPGRDNPAGTTIVLDDTSTVRHDGPGENGATETFQYPNLSFRDEAEQPAWEVLQTKLVNLRPREPWTAPVQ